MENGLGCVKGRLYLRQAGRLGYSDGAGRSAERAISILISRARRSYLVNEMKDLKANVEQVNSIG